MLNSLRARLLAATAVLLVVFIGLTGFALQTAVRERADQAEHDRLQGVAYALLGSADITDSGAFKLAPRVLPESDLSRPDSGLYAFVLDNHGKSVWHSPSLFGTIELAQIPAVGEWRFARARRANGARLLTLSFGFRWVVENNKNYRFTLVVAENAATFVKQMQRFQGVLWTLLSASALLLLIVELLILRWGLAPLRRLARNLSNLGADEKGRIEGRYPDEIQPLVSNLNTMLANDQARLTRYRNALGDLAHSLKTPMTILQGLANDQCLSDDQRRPLRGQLVRMNDILDYQLQKAAAAGKRSLTQPVAIAPVVDRLARVLGKVYADQGTRFEVRIDPQIKAAIDTGDLTELAGALMDNAAKYGGGEVIIGAARSDRALELWIDDDGPGFGEGATEKLLERGVRADTTREGQGLGLAVAAEIVRAYTGAIELTRAPSGGARVFLSIPDV